MRGTKLSKKKRINVENYQHRSEKRYNQKIKPILYLSVECMQIRQEEKNDKAKNKTSRLISIAAQPKTSGESLLPPGNSDHE